jgi:riboflavin synthase
MFTGIVEATASVISLSTVGSSKKSDTPSIAKLKVAVPVPDGDKLGDSIAVNGCCLTIAEMTPTFWVFDVSHETLKLTNLGQLGQAGGGSPRRVNLERAMTIQTRLGGHLVSGHVDGLGTVLYLNQRKDGWDLGLSIPHSLSKYCIKKGSVTVDGVSLTINDLRDGDQTSTIELCLIPTTLAVTNLGDLVPGQLVNIEVDMVGKYLERLTTFPNR